MNVYDSEQIQNMLNLLGYEKTPIMEMADLIIMNTCTIREKAEQKVFSFLGRLRALKIKRPGLVLGVGGCVAQQEGINILRKMPHVDFVFGTRAIPRLPDIVRQVMDENRRVVDIDMTDDFSAYDSCENLKSNRSPSRFVTIMRGCDNYCSYCVVPYVRGDESSRPPEEIVAQIRKLVHAGVKEVTLLGQNVNSYGKKEGFCSFAQLLEQINRIEGLLRIRFTTSHPKDLSDDIVYAFRDLEKLCPHLHLPIQSGSNRILKRMNRRYTREEYLEKINRLRIACPDVAITSDIIVGFPGESHQDFKETIELIKFVEYDSLFVFKYSDRPNAPAVKYNGKISEQEKQKRLEQVLGLQEIITKTKNAALIGSEQTVLVEGRSKMHTKTKCAQLSGRTATNKVVNIFYGTKDAVAEYDLVGKLVVVKIEKALSHSLWGKPIRSTGVCNKPKGEEKPCYAE